MLPTYPLSSNSPSTARSHPDSQLRKDQLLQILGAAMLIALAAQVSFPLPLTPVPLCLAPQVICWLAWNVPTVAPRAVALYLIGAGLQLPLLAIGRGGWVQLVGPLGGYLIGYLVAAFAVGRYRRRCGLRATWKDSLFAQCMGSALILFLGFSRLAMFLGALDAFQFGILPFLVGDFCIKAPLMSALNGSAKR